MDDIIQTKNLGEVAISNEVLLSIITKNIASLDGIKEFSPTKRSRSKLISHKGKETRISIEKNDKGELVISIPLSIRYGIPINDVSKKLQERVQREIEQKLGIKVKKVNIEILGIEK